MTVFKIDYNPYLEKITITKDDIVFDYPSRKVPDNQENSEDLLKKIIGKRSSIKIDYYGRKIDYDFLLTFFEKYKEIKEYCFIEQYKIEKIKDVLHECQSLKLSIDKDITDNQITEILSSDLDQNPKLVKKIYIAIKKLEKDIASKSEEKNSFEKQQKKIDKYVNRFNRMYASALQDVEKLYSGDIIEGRIQKIINRLKHKIPTDQIELYDIEWQKNEMIKNHNISIKKQIDLFDVISKRYGINPNYENVEVSLLAGGKKLPGMFTGKKRGKLPSLMKYIMTMFNKDSSTGIAESTLKKIKINNVEEIKKIICNDYEKMRLEINKWECIRKDHILEIKKYIEDNVPSKLSSIIKRLEGGN